MTPNDPGTGRRPDGAAFIIAVLLAAVAAVLIWQSGKIPNERGYAGIGPGDVPWMVGLGVAALAVWTALAGLSRGPREAPPPQNVPPVLWILAGLGLQLLLLQRAGFIIATALLFVCTARAFGQRNLLLGLAVGIVLTWATYSVFDGILQLNLPTGPLEAYSDGMFARLSDMIWPPEPPAEPATTGP